MELNKILLDIFANILIISTFIFFLEDKNSLFYFMKKGGTLGDIFCIHRSVIFIFSYLDFFYILVGM